MILPLEQRYPAWSAADGGDVEGIIVLGGALRAGKSVARGQPVFDVAERLVAAADLARKYPHARIVFVGGSRALTGAVKSEAQAVMRFAAEIGLDPARLETEGESRNTMEDAANTATQLGAVTGRWLLVTSAYNMPRAMELFQDAGLPVEAYPVAYTTSGINDSTAWSTDWPAGLKKADYAAREWLGLVIARVMGKSDAILPAPHAPKRAPAAVSKVQG